VQSEYEKAALTTRKKNESENSKKKKKCTSISSGRLRGVLNHEMSEEPEVGPNRPMRVMTSNSMRACATARRKDRWTLYSPCDDYAGAIPALRGAAFTADCGAAPGKNQRVTTCLTVETTRETPAVSSFPLGAKPAMGLAASQASGVASFAQ